MGDITTGIDKLVQLINRRSEISLDEAAKELNVDKAVIEDWVELLEAEKLIKVNYKFSNVLISGAKTGSRDTLKTAAHVYSQKDAFNRKIEQAIKSIDRDSEGFEQVRNEFISIQKHVKKELDTVRGELKELEKFDHLKNNIDKEIASSKKDFSKFVGQYNAQLDDFDKRYVGLVHDLKAEEVRLEKFQKSVADIKKHKAEVEKTISDAIAELKTIGSQFDEQSKQMLKSEKRIGDLKHTITNLSSHVQDRKVETIKQLNRRIGTNVQEITRKQDDLLENARAKKEEIQSYAHTGNLLYKSLTKVFDKKIKTAEMIEKIEAEKQGLIKELHDLKAKVEVFSIKANNPEIKKQLKEMESTIEKYENRRKTLVGKIDNLMKYITH